MFTEGILDKTLRNIKRLIPEPLFRLGAKLYHPLLSWTGAFRYGFPSHRLKVIGVTGTKGKSTTVYLISRILEHAGYPVAAIGSLGYKIKDKEWPNTLKMTMPGRWKLQKFLRQAADAGCTFAVIEAPSEGLAQGRHLGVHFSGAVFTGLHPEHLESHGSFEKYRAAKQILFTVCRGIHVVNLDDPNSDAFLHFPARKHITYGISGGDYQAADVVVTATHAAFTLGHTRVELKLGGLFNISNALAAIAVCDAYGVPPVRAAQALATVTRVSGRMEWVQTQPFGVVVDYAHTPDSLEAVYRALRAQAESRKSKVERGERLICVLGAAGGGRDTWKRPKFGALAGRYCDRIYLTDEDPFNEDPQRIIMEIMDGIPADARERVTVVMDRREAVHRALTDAQENDIVVITGKGSETSMAIAGDKKIPWSDRGIVEEFLNKKEAR